MRCARTFRRCSRVFAVLIVANTTAWAMYVCHSQGDQPVQTSEKLMNAYFGQLQLQAPVTITSTLRMLFKQINLRGNERKRSSQRTASIGLRFVPSVKVFS